MEWRTWGVKWGAYDIGEPNIGETSATYPFTCAWGAPRPFCEKLSDAWPDLLIAVSYGGEGPTLGRFALLAGMYLDSEDGDLEDAPTYPGEDGGETSVKRRIRAAIKRIVMRGADLLIRARVFPPTGRIKKKIDALRWALLARLEERIPPEVEEQWHEDYFEWVLHYLDQHETYVQELIEQTRVLARENEQETRPSCAIPVGGLDSIDLTSPEAPVLLILDAHGTRYHGQSGGVSCLHPEATGTLFHLHRASQLQALLDGPHHQQWCGSIDEEGLRMLDSYFAALGIPLHTTCGWHDEGWVSVEIQPVLSEEWYHLKAYADQSAILIWNNCD